MTTTDANALIESVAKDIAEHSGPDAWEDYGPASRAETLMQARATIRAVYAWLDANGWAVVPKAMTDDMTRCHLAVDKPALYRSHLRHPANGPRLAAETESEIDKALKRHTAAIAASPRPPGAA